MKTWREVIVEAKARGYFTPDEQAAAGSYLTCKVGEEAARQGVHGDAMNFVGFADRMAKPLGYHDAECDGHRFWRAVRDNCFAEADRLADAIEDRALQLKREPA